MWVGGDGREERPLKQGPEKLGSVPGSGKSVLPLGLSFSNWASRQEIRQVFRALFLLQCISASCHTALSHPPLSVPRARGHPARCRSVPRVLGALLSPAARTLPWPGSMASDFSHSSVRARRQLTAPITSDHLPPALEANAQAPEGWAVWNKCPNTRPKGTLTGDLLFKC